ncbi:MAG: DUF1611 domain-containing protein [Sphingopyxis sp.]|uniref:DUF1611 domain-containing protein n=1 Tax=Sphingopyxis sp. TaxID=1908224 RepID=UPI002ABAEE59|nr:DUF1611 domain-containing protein [Sphingopyxis sp.]MDZ3833336.1 DUF1611 domain-containing protein [Sphingopyxis sp.]
MNAPTGRLGGELTLPYPYLLFLGGTTEASYAKTAFGLADWASDRCTGEWGIEGCSVSTGLPRLSPAEARAAGARAMVIGVANQGGVIDQAWIPALVEAMDAGLDIVSGLHAKLTSAPALVEAARRTGQRLIDIRTPPPAIPTGTGRKRTGQRVLTVGTDCALGKKYTALALHRALVARGVDADFRATGQTGIMIAGGGMPMDAVISDFEAGAAEMLSPDAAQDHWDVIEGQGSIFNPAYAPVSLGLLHGSQPDVFVVCHDPTRTAILGMENFMLPSVEEVIDLTIRLGRLTNPAIRCGGVSLNTFAFAPEKAEELMAFERERLRLPVADPVRGGAAFDALVENILA